MEIFSFLCPKKQNYKLVFFFFLLNPEEMQNNLTQKRGLDAVTTVASPRLCHIPDMFPWDTLPSKPVGSPQLAGKHKSETR